MSAFDPKIDATYREFADLQLNRHYLLMEGREDSSEVEAIEQCLEELWANLDDVQRRNLNGMASDLNWIRRKGKPPPKGRQSMADVSETELQELVAAMKSKQWHRILHYLRLCARCYSALFLASERQTAYRAIDFAKYANAYAQAVAQLLSAPVEKISLDHAIFIKADRITQRPTPFIGDELWKAGIATSHVPEGKLVGVNGGHRWFAMPK